ncbi:hypothetical protein DOTSEDRAFT_28066 [Dothistroma septosporum NZE10]|uniref:Heterokaryon incompatibility domain-containing protein n=1 Tax=Dothistroma septosporum (strain NZE10 / CBS 128990) TaxID=675120 RepID=N1PEZ7_DOTSN|nr:hypothetical protein DOTSEDRAFT_28066 [Dothistroma septosporum NZE10]
MFSYLDEVSSRTSGSLETAIRSNADSHIQAYWIDAVCVPRSGPERVATLQSSVSGRERETDLIMIVEEPWMRSVWTYQEIVNAGSSTFTTFPLETPWRMEGSELFSTTGKALRDVQKNANLNGWDLARRYGGTSTLEDALADWQIGELLACQH